MHFGNSKGLAKYICNFLSCYEPSSHTIVQQAARSKRSKQLSNLATGFTHTTTFPTTPLKLHSHPRKAHLSSTSFVIVTNSGQF
jgi:hypothetical protein